MSRLVSALIGVRRRSRTRVGADCPLLHGCLAVKRSIRPSSVCTHRRERSLCGVLQGVLFVFCYAGVWRLKRSICSSSVCMHRRASALRGVLQSVHSVWHSAGVLSPRSPLCSVPCLVCFNPVSVCLQSECLGDDEMETCWSNPELTPHLRSP